jgi:hypothetical protein
MNTGKSEYRIPQAKIGPDEQDLVDSLTPKVNLSLVVRQRKVTHCRSRDSSNTAAHCKKNVGEHESTSQSRWLSAKKRYFRGISRETELPTLEL